MKSIESQEQCALIEWAEIQSRTYPELKLLHHIPNGGKRNIATAARLKKEGVKAGVPDLCLPVPKGKWHGLYIEMKAPKGTVSESQKWWIEALRKQGYCAVVRYGWEAAKDTIICYMLEREEDGQT